MQFTIKKENLLKLLYLTNSIVEKRNTMPILSNVKLVVERDLLKVAATDLEVSLLGSTTAEVISQGSIAVDAKVLYEIIRELPDSNCSIKLVKNQKLEIESGKSIFKINVTSSDEYPSIAGVEVKDSISVEAKRLHEMIEKTAFAVSTDETRYNINGVYVENLETEESGKCIRLVATDGHRLAMIERSADGLDIKKSVIIPKKGISELRKVLEDNDGVAFVSVSDGFFTVKSNDVVLGIRLVDGQFPDYKQVIPKTHKTTISLDKNSFLSAVKRVSLVTTDRSKALKLAFANNTLIVSSSSPEYGDASDSISVDQKGDDVTIGFSARYLVDVLQAMSNTETITIRLNGDLGPGLFIGTSDDMYRCVVMPMRFE